MTELIAEQLGEQHETDRWANRIWITYEKYLYDILGPFIEQMYQVGLQYSYRYIDN